MRFQRVLTSGSLCGAVGLIALGAGSTARGGANLIANPGFESPTNPANPDTTVTAWTIVGETARATFNQPSIPGSIEGIWIKTFIDLENQGIFQNVTGISAGATYDLTTQLFFEANFNQTTSTVKFGLFWQDAGGNPVGTPNVTEIPAASNPNTGSWDTYMLSGVAPGGATQIRVFLGWDFGTPGLPSVSAFFDNVDLQGPGNPPGDNWILQGSGDWNDGGNWGNGIVPNAVDASASFLGAITSPATVFWDETTPVVVGTMNFDNPNTYVISGAGQLTIDVSAGSGGINVMSGTHKINLPMTLNDNTTANVSSGATLVIADPLNLNGRTLTKSGAGNLSIISTVTGGAAPAIINSAGGTTNIDFGIGTPATASTAAVANVTVNVSGSAPTKAVFGADQTLRRLKSFTGNAGDQEIDLNGHRVRVYAADLAAEELSIYTDIKAARMSASGRDGIYDSTSPGAGWAVGVTDQSLDAHGDLSVLVRLTRQGDANVDGTVSLPDFNRLAANFGATGATVVWDRGDFNYDMVVNLQDFNLLAGNFGQSAGPDGPTPEDWANLAAAVPEPTSLVFTGVAASAAMLRRRRRE